MLSGGQGSTEHSWATCSNPCGAGTRPAALFSGSLRLSTCCSGGAEMFPVRWQQHSDGSCQQKHSGGAAVGSHAHACLQTGTGKLWANAHWQEKAAVGTCQQGKATGRCTLAGVRVHLQNHSNGQIRSYSKKLWQWPLVS